ncbi:MAG: hypothetical protein LBS79_07880 [Tannerella sp.]|jgi:DNA topoisomerase VI subunit A|nr:hypothetical protein [Tannerella sp.]
MSKKMYQSRKGSQSFYVKVDSEAVILRFTNYDKTLSIEDKKLQSALEDSEPFKRGDIVCLTVSAGRPKKETVRTTREFPEVTDWNEAVEVLQEDPYGIHPSKLQSNEAILTVAEEVGAVFPNLTVA